MTDDKTPQKPIPRASAPKSAPDEPTSGAGAHERINDLIADFDAVRFGFAALERRFDQLSTEVAEADQKRRDGEASNAQRWNELSAGHQSLVSDVTALRRAAAKVLDVPGPTPARNTNPVPSVPANLTPPSAASGAKPMQPTKQAAAPKAPAAPSPPPPKFERCPDHPEIEPARPGCMKCGRALKVVEAEPGQDDQGQAEQSA
jgi:hypothetical protein